MHYKTQQPPSLDFLIQTHWYFGCVRSCAIRAGVHAIRAVVYAAIELVVYPSSLMF
jgi:hypothetical protein